ncbi:2OG-Fe(II) oxygenase [Asticcacaulis solisilvae]|uniref:2OG-Fe(II) oxygenase n=1 Tax=Asticcacaulis solisilvae TaxID=1217274 RepID=UPI003FD899C6
MTGTKAAKSLIYANLLPGDPAPRFVQRASTNPNFVFDTVAGRYVVLAFFSSSEAEDGRAMAAQIRAHRAQFDDRRACVFGVTNDPADEARLRDALPGIRYFWDADGKIGRLYGALPRDVRAGPRLRSQWVVLDPTMRVLAVAPLDAAAPSAVALDWLAGLPAPELHAGVELQAPVLYLSNVFEPALCQDLIATYERNGGEFSGFMRERDGMTVGVRDPSMKSRFDYMLSEDDLIRRTQAAVVRRIIPEILKVHQFEVTRMERYLVGCYTADDGGHFRPHRDNTTSATAHRRFAVTINLNDDFDGGTLYFPEYGPRQFKPPPGGAVVFSCSLLHAVSPVTRGRRFAFLPFLYDDKAAALREANLGKLSRDEPLDLR